MQIFNAQGCKLGLKIAIQIPTYDNPYVFLNQLAEGTKQIAK